MTIYFLAMEMVMALRNLFPTYFVPKSNSEIIFGDEHIEILDVPTTPTQSRDGAQNNETTAAQATTKQTKSVVTTRHLAEAYAQPEDTVPLNVFQ